MIKLIFSLLFIFALVMMVALLAWSVGVNAPLEEAANPSMTPNSGAPGLPRTAGYGFS